MFVEDFDGTVLHIQSKGLVRSQVNDATLLDVCAGEDWHDLVKWTLSNDIYGLENLALIPGSVGAAPIQNIGAYGREIAEFVEHVDCIDLHTGVTHRLSAEECKFGYRDSIFKREGHSQLLVTSVRLRFPQKWQPVTNYGELRELDDVSPHSIFNEVIRVRQSKLPDPDVLGNAGSFFKNPVVDAELLKDLNQTWPDIPAYQISEREVKIPAAWLIDKLGFKGKALGGIRCHHNQPLVLTNTGQGTGPQLLELARDIRDSVLETFGIALENEVRLIGKQGLIEL